MTKKTFNIITDFIEDPSFVNWVKKEKLSDETFWEYWLENNPDKREIVEEAKDIVLGIQLKKAVVSEEKIDFEWNKFKSAIKEKQEKTTVKKETISKPNYNKWLGIAASFILILSVVLLKLSGSSTITHETGYGEILDLKLKDGSLVTLNANSSLSYKKDNSRKIWLKGEAYFQVDKKQTTNAKFWVITNDLEVEVYGTVFNVNTKEEKTQVYLEEGNIWLALKNGDSKKMLPGNFISYSSKENKILVEQENILAEEQTSWKNGTLTFNNLSLEDALKKVTETYGYEVIFRDNESKHSLITGTVPTTNIDICLQAIKKSVNVEIIKENSKLVVTKK